MSVETVNIVIFAVFVVMVWYGIVLLKKGIKAIKEKDHGFSTFDPRIFAVQGIVLLLAGLFILYKKFLEPLIP